MDRNAVVVGLVVIAVVLGSGPGAAAASFGGTPATSGEPLATSDAVDATAVGGPAVAFDLPDNETENGTTNETTSENETVSDENETVAGDNETGDNESVSAGVGRQLSTVVTVTGEEVREDVSNASLVAAFQRANETERAVLLASRMETLSGQADEVAAEYDTATAAFENGTITTGEYAHRLALLNARSNTVENGLERVQRLAEDVSALELRAAGYDASTVQTALAKMDRVSGPGASALLQQFTNGTQGTVDIQTKGGFSVSVEQEGGETSREFEREGDDNTSFSVSQSDALSTARSTLSTVENGTWVLRGSSVDTDDGTYTFRFRLSSSNDTGEAEVTVDGSAGSVVELEEEVEPLHRGPPEDTPGVGPGGENGEGEDGDDETDEDGTAGNESAENGTAGNGTAGNGTGGPPDDVPGNGSVGEDDDSDGEIEDLSLLVTDGTPTPNATLTVRLLAAGEPVSNATIRLNGAAVATTGADGTATVTLPASGEAKLRATYGGEDAELEFEFGEDDSDEIRRNLDATGTVENGTVTITVTYDGEGVAGAAAVVDGERVGRTGPDGTLSFDAPAGELDVTVRKGQFTATLSFDVSNDSVTLTGTDTGEDEEENEADEADEREEDDESDEEDEEDDESDEEDEEDDGDDEKGEGNGNDDDEKENDENDDGDRGEDEDDDGDRGEDEDDDGDRGEDEDDDGDRGEDEDDDGDRGGDGNEDNRGGNDNDDGDRGESGQGESDD
jgi:hypothetical protein